MKRAAIWILGGLFGLIFTVAAILAGCGLWLVRSVPQMDGRTTVAGLHAPVDIVRDSHAVPYIEATDAHDGFFALGWLHAEDRLFQMDMTRRSARGTLSELLGAAALDADRYARTLGLGAVADGEYADASPPLKAALDAYAQGINAWIAQHSGPLPPEYTLLLADPSPWAPADTLAVGRVMAMMLANNWQTEALRARLLTHLTPAQVDFLAPTTGGGPTMDGSGELRPFPPGPHAALGPLPDLADRLPAIGPGASNVWIVGGGRTQTGRPILASDPHLGLAAPGLWYLVRLKTPELEFTGATIPGIPFPMIGHNGHVAWGQTTMGGDAADLFVEKIDPADPGRYLAPGGPLPFTVRHETIKVRFGDPDVLAVRETRHGPVVSDLDHTGVVPAGSVVALAHAGLVPGDRTAEALLGFVEAQSASAFRNAARDFMSPAQNLAYADTQGHFGLVSAGRLPTRKGGDGRLPADGSAGTGDWTGWVPFESLPQMQDPAAGILFNANNATADPSAPVFLGADFDVPYRAERIAALIKDAHGYSLADAQAGQHDTRDGALADIVPRLLSLAAPADERGRAAAARLKGWDFGMRADAAEPLIAMAWIRRFGMRVFADEMGADFAGWQGFHPRQILAVLDGDSAWCDDRATPATESCADQATAALGEALDELAATYGPDWTAWRWGEAHRARLRHPLFDRIPLLDRLTRLDRPTAGGDAALLRGASRLGTGDEPFANSHAAGLRAVFDLADLDRSRFIISTGQSGNPYSRHYGDLTGLWAGDGMIEIPKPSGNGAAHRQALLPP